jgi:hypothetical protein
MIVAPFIEINGDQYNDYNFQDVRFDFEKTRLNISARGENSKVNRPE